MKVLNKIGNLLKRISDDYVGEYAAQSAFYTFLSLMPFSILLLSLIKYMNIEKDTLMYILDAFIPSIMENSSLNIVQEVYSKSIETISFSVILLLWSAGKSFYSLTKGLTSIYKGKQHAEASNVNYILLRLKGIARNNHYFNVNSSYVGNFGIW